ncbi:hypothetical protein M378DRAFT_302177 [Amanita muscaria Koide BX008]|uniref:Uncharacterized protein n=1 Tax=Amanita muscaria (strain Koide BX008) TaxID=946122 RepID=A0A0C2XD22_AMAMK|nr:hypothetical protein M378DRAFT_302177 [Amanita muscaria Koide BX008]
MTGMNHGQGAHHLPFFNLAGPDMTGTFYTQTACEIGTRVISARGDLQHFEKCQSRKEDENARSASRIFVWVQNTPTFHGGPSHSGVVIWGWRGRRQR